MERGTSRPLRPCGAKCPYAAFYEAAGSTAQPLVLPRCHPSPPCLRHRAPTRGVPNLEQRGGRPGRAVASQAWRGREPAQPEGLGVCRARCVLCGPDGTYPGRVPTQPGAGRPARARGTAVRPAPRQSTPGAACTAPAHGSPVVLGLGCRGYHHPVGWEPCKLCSCILLFTRQPSHIPPSLKLESYNCAHSFLGSAAPQDPVHHAQPQRCPCPPPALPPLQTKQGQLLVEHRQKKM